MRVLKCTHYPRQNFRVAISLEFLTIYQDEEYIRRHTKGMLPEEARQFALNYYGWSDNTDESQQFVCTVFGVQFTSRKTLNKFGKPSRTLIIP